MECETDRTRNERGSISPKGFVEVPRNASISLDQLKSIVAEIEPVVWGTHGWFIRDAEASDDTLFTAFWGNCGNFSGNLRAILEDRYAITSYLVTSAHPNSHFHVYLVLGINEGAIVIDPSIGQYVRGLRGSFIGTRAELQQLIEASTTNLQPGRPTEYCGRRDFFVEVWGDFCHELKNLQTVMEEEYNNSLQANRLPPAP